jgi:hypothetical protein
MPRLTSSGQALTKSEGSKGKIAADFPNDAGKQTSGNNAGVFTDCAEKYGHELTQVNTKLEPPTNAG